MTNNSEILFCFRPGERCPRYLLGFWQSKTLKSRTTNVELQNTENSSIDSQFNQLKTTQLHKGTRFLSHRINPVNTKTIKKSPP